jgi:hypothetical protein
MVSYVSCINCGRAKSIELFLYNVKRDQVKV